MIYDAGPEALVGRLLERHLADRASPDGSAGAVQCDQRQSTGDLKTVMRTPRLRDDSMRHEPSTHTPSVLTTTLSIDAMSCGGCARHLTAALESEPGVIGASTDVASRQVAVEHLPPLVPEEHLLAIVARAGYPGARVVHRSQEGLAKAAARAGGGCCCSGTR